MPESSAQPAHSWKVVEVVVNDIHADGLHALVDRLITSTGCRTCGLGGVDLRIMGRPPEVPGWHETFEGIPGVVSTTVRQAAK